MIRNMNIYDYNEVYELWINTPGMGLNDLDDSRDGFEKYLSRNPNTCFVAEKDNKIVGVILSGHDGRRGYIYHTAVSASQRGSGIGTALVDAAVSALAKEGISKVALVAFSANTTGNAFWENRGFSERPDLKYRNRDIRELKRIDT